MADFRTFALVSDGEPILINLDYVERIFPVEPGVMRLDYTDETKWVDVQGSMETLEAVIRGDRAGESAEIEQRSK